MEKAAIALVTVIALAIGIFAAQPAQARSPVFITTEICGMFDADKATLEVPGIIIETKSSKNNVIMICKAELGNPTGKAIRYDFSNIPFACESPLGHSTTDWKEVISASGQATMTCHFKS